MVTEETLGSIIQLLKKKSSKKNYQDILIQYLNSLNDSNTKIDIVTKNMKIAFFNCISDLVLNKNDELKYLILYFNEKYKKNNFEKYFNIWKKVVDGANNQNNIKNYLIENINNIIYRNNKSNNNFKLKDQKYFPIEENIDNIISKKEKSLIEIKKYIIDFDEENEENNNIRDNLSVNKNILINQKNKNSIIAEEKYNIDQNIRFNIENKDIENNKINYYIRKKIQDENLNNSMIKNYSKEMNKRTKTDDDYENNPTFEKNFKEMEEDYRIKYLLCSKGDINDNEANNIINLKDSINKAINNTRNNINKIDEYESINKSKNKNMDKQLNNENINVMIFDSLEQINKNIHKSKSTSNLNNNINKDFSNKKYFINNDMKIEKINTKVINNFNIKLEALSQTGNRNNRDKLYYVSNVNEFSFAPVSSSHNTDKNNHIINKINKNKKSEKILSIKDLSESDKNDNNNYIPKEKDNKLFNNKINEILKERLINEEMIQSFLRNQKNEGIFQNYKIKKADSDKIINSYNYKNKYLGHTLGGVKRRRQLRSNSNILKSDHSIEIYINKSDDETINKSNITSLKKDNSNFLTINKINSMLEEMFTEEKIKKPGFNISNTENNSFNISSLTNNNKSINYHERNQIKKNQITNMLNYSNFNKRSSLNTKQNNNKNELVEKNKNKIFDVNIKGNNKKYILNSNKYFTCKNISKNSSSLISKKNSLKLNIPLSNMTFNERLEFFKNKKGSDIQKIKSHINTIENDIYTFCPKTNKIIDTVSKEKKYKSLNKKLNNNSNSKENIRNKINYDYLNGLYLDYKKRKVRLKILREENDKEDGISFIPSICKNSRWDKSE